LLDELVAWLLDWLNDWLSHWLFDNLVHSWLINWYNLFIRFASSEEKTVHMSEKHKYERPYSCTGFLNRNFCFVFDGMIVENLLVCLFGKTRNISNNIFFHIIVKNSIFILECGITFSSRSGLYNHRGVHKVGFVQVYRGVHKVGFVQVYRGVHKVGFVQVYRGVHKVGFVQVYRVVHKVGFVQGYRGVHKVGFVQIYRGVHKVGFVQYTEGYIR